MVEIIVLKTTRLYSPDVADRIESSVHDVRNRSRMERELINRI